MTFLHTIIYFKSYFLYLGFAGGQHYTQSGGASNYVCLPMQPEYNEVSKADTGTWIYGAEYQSFKNIFTNMNDQNVPCAVCYTSARSASTMIPARRSCPTNWTKVNLNNCTRFYVIKKYILVQKSRKVNICVFSSI